MNGYDAQNKVLEAYDNFFSQFGQELGGRQDIPPTAAISVAAAYQEILRPFVAGILSGDAEEGADIERIIAGIEQMDKVVPLNERAATLATGLGSTVAVNGGMDAPQFSYTKANPIQARLQQALAGADEADYAQVYSSVIRELIPNRQSFVDYVTMQVEELTGLAISLLGQNLLPGLETSRTPWENYQGKRTETQSALAMTVPARIEEVADQIYDQRKQA
jgi:hypothetical protein